MNIIQPIYDGTTLQEELSGVTNSDLDTILQNFQYAELRQIVVPVLDGVIDGIQVHKYEGQAISRFVDKVSGDTIIGTADGFFVNVSEMIAEFRSRLVD